MAYMLVIEREENKCLYAEWNTKRMASTSDAASRDLENTQRVLSSTSVTVKIITP